MARRVVVIDSGWGGELVADLIEEELAIVEVVRVIDWRHAPYSRRRRAEILALVEEHLRPYWDRVDAVVLGGYEASLVEAELRTRHPGKPIVAFRLERFLKVLTEPAQRVLLLSDPRLLLMAECEAVVSELKKQGTEVLMPECRGWTELIDDGELTEETIGTTLLGEQAGGRVNAVLLANTHYWDLIGTLRGLFASARIIDLRWELMRDVCRALGLRGGSGRKRK